MDYRIFQPIALSIYKNSLSSLMNDDWLLSIFPQYLEFLISKRKLPNELFNKPICKGYLYLLGLKFFDQLFAITDDVLFCDVETAYRKSKEVFYFLIGSGVKDSDAIFELLMAIDRIDEIITETPESRRNSVFHRQGVHFLLQDALVNIEDYHRIDIEELKDIYALNYEERAFHDRQICEYITFALSNMYGEKGYPILEKGMSIKYSKIKRQNMPSWVKPTLMARERNSCANCGVNFTELQGKPHIDHIVPLSKGGCNDIVNLQLLCSACNQEKLDNQELVKSSIPKYFSRLKKVKRNNHIFIF